MARPPGTDDAPPNEGPAGAPAAPEVLAPKSVILDGRYRIERELGRGGMGIVYEATHLMLGRKVAIKMLSPAMRKRPDLANRMIREARAVSTIGHPNIVAVTDLGLVAGLPYIVMELLAGVSVEDELAHRGPMPVSDAIVVTEAVLDALDAAHRRGIVHRDIKPGNIMLVRDGAGRRTVKVLDFGIAKIIDGDQVTTKTSFVLGTPLAMAPEQALGEDVDARADLHAVGSLLYTMLVGEAPFAGANANVAIARALEGKYTPAGARVAGVSSALDAVIAKALARAREDRWPDAAAMRAALHTCLPGAKPAGPRRASAVIAPPVAATPSRTSSDPDVPLPVSRPTAPAGAPAHDPRFGPAPIERLDVQTLIDRPPVRVAEVPQPPSRTGRTLLFGGVAIAAGLLGWRWLVNQRSTATTHTAMIVEEPESGLDDAPAPEDAPAQGGTVLLMVTTTPKDAVVFVDDVRAAKNPVTVPRSDTMVRVRVEAPGYEPRVVEVQPKRSRQLEVKLDRRRR
jgi:serine/threonine protein kinase